MLKVAFFIDMLSVVMLSVAFFIDMLSVTMLSVASFYCYAVTLLSELKLIE
jgi:hypothetical protein